MRGKGSGPVRPDTAPTKGVGRSQPTFPYREGPFRLPNGSHCTVAGSLLIRFYSSLWAAPLDPHSREFLDRLLIRREKFLARRPFACGSICGQDNNEKRREPANQVHRNAPAAQAKQRLVPS